MQRTRDVALVVLAAMVLMALGCSSFRETLPGRSATEQVLISTAADRAVEEMPTGWVEGRAVFVNTSNLESYDKTYLVQRLRDAVLDGGGALAENAEGADVVLEVASGGLSVDTSSFLIGIPSTAIPVPFADVGLEVPELALFKRTSYVGKAKLLVNAVDSGQKTQIAEVPLLFGRAYRRFWWFVFIGPIDTSDIPDPMR